MFEGVAVGMLLGAAALGFRHGIDWDHLAALADLTGYGETKRRRMGLATMYALGHATVVFALGVAAIVLGASLPDGVDTVMERIVGATLVLLGLWVLISLTRQGRSFRLQSRWMLVSSGVMRGVARLRRDEVVVVEHEHEHEHERERQHGHHADTHFQASATTREGAAVGAGPSGPIGSGPARTHTHPHHHVGVVRDPFSEPSLRIAAGLGCLHGIGAETPTQIVLLTTAAGVQGRGAGVAFLVAFVVGLIASNTTVASAMAVGRIDPERSFRLYAGLSITIALFSIVAGSVFLLGGSGSLPAISQP